jgi:hypothetical protein
LWIICNSNKSTQCLDFDRLSEWHNKFIVSTTVSRPGSDSNKSPVRGIEAMPGDSLEILSGGFIGLAKVQVSILLSYCDFSRCTETKTKSHHYRRIVRKSSGTSTRDVSWVWMPRGRFTSRLSRLLAKEKSRAGRGSGMLLRGRGTRRLCSWLGRRFACT